MKMIVGIHQPEHLPWLGFLNKAYMSDVFVLLDNVQFEKNYFQNRNKIKTQKGESWLTVPILTSGKPDQMIKDCLIDNKQNWQKKCWKTIEFAYKKAPFFEENMSFFEEIYNRKFNRLVDFNKEVIDFLFKQFNIAAKVVFSSELEAKGKKSDLLLNICEKLKADTYLSGTSGREYLELDKFKKKRIKVIFQDFQHPKYPQLWGEFIPNMSSIDLLFNCGSKGAELFKFKRFASK